ncbi:hypothetical protein PBI_HUFFY_67 [Gordonia phage Huffy]|uniref:Uncharacterized protein n=3 Tax=Vendettavirus TaxID=2049885 RepID=A0A160DFK4_9CAUD|nr:hypothetical protein BH795_gp44 [Gordonia phage Vendetta]YP_009275421.1 hypothetical protein BH760_gp44 [Gordonia phage Splinter]YP_010051156.1 hypothetical protein KDJ61_gp48 [Gordonia phage TZGordon]AQY55668.1 hypothetical protein PBI_HUFFY_67 [Gordonia phage Huffy]AQY55751.1 hypothetical protein PBI_DINODARYN_67 [Gordonia phage DinoDaryn]WNO25809.1 hypothetical protein SEA_GOIB_67 [Gordonia phage Goib]ANA85614.1 hypothetical protein PBI_VENDETTA_67 [Gordonia phage Vendetta]ANA85693.1 h
MDQKQVDELIGKFRELRELDAWLAEQHAETRGLFTEVAFSLKALCEAVPAWKDYVTEALQK